MTKQTLNEPTPQSKAINVCF